MPSTSPFAYPDIRKLLDRALESERGGRIPCESWGAAKNLAQRINGCRTTDRRTNKKVYEEDHPLHGRSIYDVISVHVPAKDSPDCNYVYLKNLGGVEIEFEEL